MFLLTLVMLILEQHLVLLKHHHLLEFDLNTGGDALTVDGVSYTFPLGDKTTVIVGDNTDGSALFN